MRYILLLLTLLSAISGAVPIESNGFYFYSISPRLTLKDEESSLTDDELDKAVNRYWFFRIAQNALNLKVEVQGISDVPEVSKILKAIEKTSKEIRSALKQKNKKSFKELSAPDSELWQQLNDTVSIQLFLLEGPQGTSEVMEKLMSILWHKSLDDNHNLSQPLWMYLQLNPILLASYSRAFKRYSLKQEAPPLPQKREPHPERLKPVSEEIKKEAEQIAVSAILRYIKDILEKGLAKADQIEIPLILQGLINSRYLWLYLAGPYKHEDTIRYILRHRAEVFNLAIEELFDGMHLKPEYAKKLFSRSDANEREAIQTYL